MNTIDQPTLQCWSLVNHPITSLQGGFQSQWHNALSIDTVSNQTGGSLKSIFNQLKI
jgi:hypothetical protein